MLIVGCALTWGLGQVASKAALIEVPPLTQAGMRSLGAALLIAAWARFKGIPLLERDGTLWPGVLAGLLFAGEFAALYTGLGMTTAGRMTVFLYLAPFVVALGMPLLLRTEHLNPIQVGGLIAAFLGVALAFSEGFTSGSATPRQWLGDSLGVLAAVMWGATTLLVRATKLATAAPAKTLLYQLGVSALTLLPVGLLTEHTAPWPWHGWVTASMVFQIVVVSSVSYLVWFWMVRHYPATKLSAFTLLTPLMALIAGAVLLSEHITTRLVIALVTVCTGIFLVNRAGGAGRSSGEGRLHGRRRGLGRAR